jgi:UDP-N-acetylglucosamine 1-carboxyvinyltransferase
MKRGDDMAEASQENKSELIIEGGHQISGTHIVPGNKNAALPMLTACLLTEETVVIENLPQINDVKTTLSMLEKLGVKVVSDPENRKVEISAKDLKDYILNSELSAKVRATILFAGPMIARMGKVAIAEPGGDVIGRRRIDTHITGLAALGAAFANRSDGVKGYRFDAHDGLFGADIILDEASVTATENIIMAATLAKGRTTIYNAACEPHIQDLCNMLNAMGAKIFGAGTNYVIIDGVEKLHGATVRVGADYIDAGSYIVAALVTGGELKVKGIDKRDFIVLEKAFAKFGVKWTITGDELHLPGGQRLSVTNDYDGSIPKIEDGIWPAFPSDLMSILIVLAIYSEGTMMFFEKMFESRMYFVDHLINMGAKIVQCDPHRIVVIGSSKPTLIGRKVSSPDIRAGIALVIAALGANGETVIQNAQSIDRGYEDIERSLGELGAVVSRRVS